MTKQVFQTTFAGRELIVETGQVAKQANGSVVVRYGESTVLTAAVMSKENGNWGFLPLQVNYEEKCMRLGSFLVALWNRKDVLQQMRLWQRVWLTVRSVQCLRKVSVTKCKSSTQSFLTMKMHLHQWQPCLVHHWLFYFRYSIWRTNRWGTSRLCDGEIMVNPTQEQAERSLLNWQ